MPIPPTAPVVPWQRYWIPAGVTPALDSAEYLRDLLYQRSPADPVVQVANRDARTLAQLADTPCLVLLGEPGAGKSTELAQLDDTDAVRIDLGRIGGEVGFLDKVSRHARLREWKEEGRPLTLILDAYDEAFLRVEAAAALLGDAITDGLPEATDIRRQRARSLRLRVTSRGGVWRKSITEAFQGLWGVPNVGVYTLAPLRRADVSQAAGVWGLSPDAFQTALRESGVESLGALPLTLGWLLDIYRDDGALPPTWRETLDLAVHRLCTEHNPGRLDADRDGYCTPQQRAALAGRLAALMRFGDCAALDLGAGQTEAEGVLLGASAHGEERGTDGAAFSVDREALRDFARDTALLQNTEPDLFRWTQAAIADYLAAWYLCHRGASLRQSLSLLTDPSDGRVVPQLVSVAACAASLDPDVFLALSERDPGVALGELGVKDHSEDVRQKGVELYLQSVANQNLLDSTGFSGISLQALAHPGLAGQLERWIGDSAQNEDARAAAMRLAAQNRLRSLSGLVCDLALDEGAPLDLRTTAAQATGWIGSLGDKDRLRPLLHDSTRGDGGAWLRLAARNVLWPDQLSVENLVASEALDESDPGDVFTRDLRWQRLFAEDMASDKLVDVLDWVLQGNPSDAPDVATGALAAAARRAGEDAVGRRLAPLLVRYASRDERDGIRLDPSSVHQALAEQKGGRPAFVDALAAALVTASSEGLHTLRNVFHRFAPVRVEDGIGLIARMLDAPNDALREVYAFMLRSVVAPSEEGPLGELWSALQEAAPRCEQIGRIVTQALDNAQARKAREDEERGQPLSPTISERIDAGLAAPQARRWNQIASTLTLDPNRDPPRYVSREIVSPSSLPAWSRLSPEQQDHVGTAADEYVRSVVPDEADWEALAEHGHRTPALDDGVRALALLYRMGRPVSDETWAAWAPALLFRWPHSHSEEPDAYGLLKQAHRARPEAVRQTFGRLVCIDTVRIGSLARPFGLLGDSDLDRLMLEALLSGRIHEDDRRTVLEGLLKRRTPDATEHAAALVDQARDASAAAWAALLLFTTQPADAWARYADRVRADDAFARYLLGNIAVRRHDATLPEDAPVEALVALERRLAALYPPANDPPRPKGMHSPSREDRIRDLRGGFTSVLAGQGSDASVDAIESLHDVLSEDTLRDRLLHARRRRREVARRPIEPGSLLELLRDRTARLARSADELFAVITEALDGPFEEWLRAPRAPRVYDLWNHIPRAEALRLAAAVLRHDDRAETVADELDDYRTRHRKGVLNTLSFPRDERALSDAALRFLRERLGPGGALVDREVEIQRGHATDLLVSVPASEHDAEATVVIEVKGSWHGSLYSSLGTQLAHGYIDGTTLRHGVYLAGWYGPAGWYDVAPGEQHPKAKQARKGGPDNVRMRLRGEADSVSAPNRHVVAIVVDASLPPPRAS